MVTTRYPSAISLQESLLRIEEKHVSLLKREIFLSRSSKIVHLPKNVLFLDYGDQ